MSETKNNIDVIEELSRKGIALQVAVNPAAKQLLFEFAERFGGNYSGRTGPLAAKRHALLHSYSEAGTLVHVRWDFASPETCQVATASLHHPEAGVTLWRVNDVRYDQAGLTRGVDVVPMELVLTHDQLDLLDGEGKVSVDIRDDPLQQALAVQSFRDTQAGRDAMQARVVLTRQGVYFKPWGESSQRQELGPLSVLVQRVAATEQLGARAAELLVDRPLDLSGSQSLPATVLSDKAEIIA